MKPVLRALILPLISSVTTVYGQDDEAEEIFELSPFEVKSGTGYVQTRSLAGTRLNSELSNIPQQISTMTEDFLDDIAATTPQDALLYSLNVENLSEYSEGGANGHFARGINDLDFSGRIRGISSAGRMRDFFQTVVQGDTYNLDQLTVSSGPNAVIYGLAGTGGVINASFKKAMYADSFASFETRVDSEESVRFTLDVNQEVIKDTLSFRFISLWDDFKTYRNSSDGEQERYFLTVSARPWKGANLQAYYENVEIDKSLPRNVVAYDGGVTAYLEHVANGGDPYFDNSLQTTNVEGWEGLIQRSAQPRDLWVLQGEGTPVDIGLTNGRNGYWVRTIDPRLQAPDPSDQFRWSLPPDSPIVSPEHNVHGLTTGRNMKAEIYGAVFNQQITPNLFIELGFNKEESPTAFYNMAQPGAALVRVDPNLYLPDGVTPNPWKGMMYTEHFGVSINDLYELYGMRATVSYNLDLTEKSKWLGRHNFMGLLTRDRMDNLWSWNNTRTIPANQVDDYKFDARNRRNNGQTFYRWYIDPVTYEMINPFDPLTGGPQPDGTFVYSLDNSPAAVNVRTTLSEAEGATGAVQSFWLNDRVVTTLGYRQGWFTQGQAHPELLVNTEDVVWGWQHGKDINRDLDTWEPETKEDAINYGAVAHLTKPESKLGQISAFYNWADIFNSPSSAHFADGSPIPSAIGESYDFGIMWSRFDSKIGLRLNWYKTKSENANDCTWCGDIRGPVTLIEQGIGAPGRQSQVEDNYAVGLADGDYVDSFGNPITTPPVPFDPSTFALEERAAYFEMVANRESKGVEIEAWANPTENWTFRLTAADNEARDKDSLKGWGQWIRDRYSYWRAWAEWEQNTFLVGNETSLATAAGSVTNRFNSLAATYTTLVNSDGTQVNQNAGWRVNLTGKYNFSEGPLNGAHLGAHIRYRQAPVIGYLSLPADSPFPDWPGSPAEFKAPSLDNPVEAPNRYDFDVFAGYRGKLMNDKIRYTVRLNIRNVLNDTDIVPQRSRSDGSVAVYTFKQPRLFILSTEFSF